MALRPPRVRQAFLQAVDSFKQLSSRGWYPSALSIKQRRGHRFRASGEGVRLRLDALLAKDRFLSVAVIEPASHRFKNPPAVFAAVGSAFKELGYRALRGMKTPHSLRFRKHLKTIEHLASDWEAFLRIKDLPTPPLDPTRIPTEEAIIRSRRTIGTPRRFASLIRWLSRRFEQGWNPEALGWARHLTCRAHGYSWQVFFGTHWVRGRGMEASVTIWPQKRFKKSDQLRLRTLGFYEDVEKSLTGLGYEGRWQAGVKKRFSLWGTFWHESKDHRHALTEARRMATWTPPVTIRQMRAHPH